MKRSIAAVLALLALAGCGPKPATHDADPALWVVRDADTTVYLFGTVHMLKPGLSWFDEAVRQAFDASGELVLETVVPGDAEMNALVAELGTQATGPALTDQLPPAEAAQFRKALPELGMSAEALDRAEPWLAATLLSALPLRKLGYDEAEGAEAVLTAAARKAGKPVRGLESVREQLGYFDALPVPAQRALLIEALHALPQAGQSIEAAVKAWSAGDPDTLGRLVNEDVASSPELSETLLANRNRSWAGWIAGRMAQPGTLFVAVGAGHLAGAGSVQHELAKRGLKVERVRY